MAVTDFRSTAILTIFHLPFMRSDEAKTRRAALLADVERINTVSRIEFGVGAFAFRACALVPVGSVDVIGELRSIAEKYGGQWQIEDTPNSTMISGGAKSA